MRLFRFCLDRGLQLPRALQKIPVRTVYLFAEKNYHPASRFQGELVLFRATGGNGPDEPYVERYATPCLAGDGVQVVTYMFTTSLVVTPVCSRSRMFGCWPPECSRTLTRHWPVSLQS